MYQFSDSDTADSDDGIRFKTATTRHKSNKKDDQRRNAVNSNDRRELSRKPLERSRSRGRSRSRSRGLYRHRISKSRSISPKRYTRKKHKKTHRRSRSRSKSIERVREGVPAIKIHKTPSASVSVSSGCLSSEGKQIGSDKCSPTPSPISIKSLKPLIATEVVAAEDICGPALPPYLSGNHIVDSNDQKTPVLPEKSTVRVEHTNDLESEDVCEPMLHPSEETEADSVCGPALPPHLLSKNTAEQAEINEELSPLYKEERSIGPFIPEHLRKQLAKNTELGEPQTEDQQDEATESVDCKVDQDDDNEDGDCYGPLPPETQKKSRAYMALEERALQIKLDQLGPQSTNETVREEWMLELPTVQASNLGLGPRQFRAKAGPDLSDRSSWTDTPNSNCKKVPDNDKAEDLQRTVELDAFRQRDDEQEALAKKARKKNKRDKSLLEQHQDKLNAKKKDEQQQGVRRPFNRDTDLKVNQFDDAQKKSIMKKAQLLDSRFSQGKSKFL